MKNQFINECGNIKLDYNSLNNNERNRIRIADNKKIKLLKNIRIL